MTNATFMNTINLTTGVTESQDSSAQKCKVNFFKADRTMSTRVADFMFKFFKKDELNKTYKARIAKMQESITTLENMEKEGTKLMTDEQIAQTKTLYMAQIAQYEQEYADELKAQATFVMNTDNDKKLKNALKKAGMASDLVYDAYCEWFAAYDLDVRNTYFMDEVMQYCTNYKNSAKQGVKSNGVDVRVVDINKNMQLLYSTCFTAMVNAGTIKPAQVPTLLQEVYAQKKKKAN